MTMRMQKKKILMMTKKYKKKMTIAMVMKKMMMEKMKKKTKSNKKNPPGHPLNKALPKMVVGDGDLQIPVIGEVVVVPEQHNLVMLAEMVVGDGDSRRAMDSVHEPIVTVVERVVVYPDIPPPENRYPIAISNRPPSIVIRRVPHQRIPSLLAVMDMKPVNDDVAHVLYSDARPPCDVHDCPAPVDRLVRIHQQLLLKRDCHIIGKDDPKWFLLDDGVTESARSGVDSVIVAGVHDHIDLAVLSADGVLAEADRAVGQSLPVGSPVRVAPPAVIDRVARVA